MDIKIMHLVIFFQYVLEYRRFLKIWPFFADLALPMRPRGGMVTNSQFIYISLILEMP